MFCFLCAILFSATYHIKKTHLGSSWLCSWKGEEQISCVFNFKHGFLYPLILIYSTCYDLFYLVQCIWKLAISFRLIVGALFTVNEKGSSKWQFILLMSDILGQQKSLHGDANLPLFTAVDNLLKLNASGFELIKLSWAESPGVSYVHSYFCMYDSIFWGDAP